jgi:hypothetical protein
MLECIIGKLLNVQDVFRYIFKSILLIISFIRTLSCNSKLVVSSGMYVLPKLFSFGDKEYESLDTPKDIYNRFNDNFIYG